MTVFNMSNIICWTEKSLIEKVANKTWLGSMHIPCWISQSCQKFDQAAADIAPCILAFKNHFITFQLRNSMCIKFYVLTNEPPRDKTDKMTCAPSEDSDQPGHLPSLMRVFAVCMKEPWVLSYPLRAQRRLVRSGGCPNWSESSLGAQVILLVLSCSGSNEPCHDKTC